MTKLVLSKGETVALSATQLSKYYYFYYQVTLSSFCLTLLTVPDGFNSAIKLLLQ